MNVLLNLQWLIGGVRDDEIGGKNLFELCKFLIDRLTEVCDLFLIAHIDRQGDCSAALPLSSGDQPRVIVQIYCCVALLVSCDISQLDANIMSITDDDWRPTVRMQIGPLQLFLNEYFHEAMDTRIIFVRNTIESNKATS